MRRVLPGIAVAATVLLALVGAAIYALFRGEIQETRLTDRAQVAGSVERGWLPRTIPASAVDCRLRTDLDLNTSYFICRVDDPAELAELREIGSAFDPERVPLYWQPGWWRELKLDDEATRIISESRGSFLNVWILQIGSSGQMRGFILKDDGVSNAN